MNRPKALIALCLALFIFACSVPVASQTGTPDGPANRAQKLPKLDFVPGEIMVRFRDEAQARRVERSSMSVRSKGRTIQVNVKEFKGSKLVDGLRIARVAASDTLQAIEELNAHPDVLYAEPNFIRKINRLPNDPSFSQLWGLRNPNEGGRDIDAEQAWDTTVGSRGVVVGVIDEGIDINHEDLRDNIWHNPAEVANDGVDNDGNGYVDDVNGWDFYHNDKTVFDGTGQYPDDETDSHGTHVAGTIGATGDNGIGVTGVNWQVSLMSLKILGPGGGSSASAVSAYNYASQMRELWETSGGTKGANIRVLNNSYGGYGHSQAELDAIRALGDKGILFVVSAGNESMNNDIVPSYPTNYIAANLISVAATNSSDIKPNFSNSGSATVNVAAPGVGILSTTPGNTYDFYDGTSMAAPHVSGAAALVCSAFPNISMRRLRSALLYSGDILNSQAIIQIVSSGRRLNVAKALQSAGSTDSTAPSMPVLNTINQGWYSRYMSLFWTAPGDDGTSGKAAAYEVRFSETELTNPTDFELARPLPVNVLPNSTGPFDSWNADIPWQYTTGFVGVRAVDEVGNAGPILSVPFKISPHVGDPYTITKAAPSALSTGGTPLALIGDDLYKYYNLPFAPPFFIEGSTTYAVTVSTNGALYIGPEPRNSKQQPDDAVSSESRLQGFRMIAGLWDDLRTDRRTGDDVYVVQPDA
ncbi:MAG TPA: S8 family peptidase, partial [Pyrinomonadaceae bacterium]|nr:S8 family peptidase [Pyrinomonadaceae bacterium]